MVDNMAAPIEIKTASNIWFSGFNGFGQFGQGHSDKKNQLQAMKLPVTDMACPSDHNQIQISCTWSYNALAVGSQLHLSGLINKSLDQWQTIDFERCIRKIAANDKACLVLLDNGDLFKVCPNTLTNTKLSFISVEHTTNQRRQRLGPIFADNLVTEPDDENSKSADEPEIIVDIISTSTFSVALTSSNALYTIPSKVHQFAQNERVVKMCGGSEHVLALTSNGDVYAFGSSSRGQLGHGSTDTEEAPLLVEALAGVKIVDISCGSWHSAAVSTFGDLYMWGWNLNGQLGRPVFKQITIKYSNGRTEQIKHKMASVFPLPEIIDLPRVTQDNSKVDNNAINNDGDDLDSQYEVCRVYCGARHTVVRTKCNQTLVSGWNRYGQCVPGAENKKDICEFTKLDNFPSEITNFVCGSWCTIFQ